MRRGVLERPGSTLTIRGAVFHLAPPRFGVQADIVAALPFPPVPTKPHTSLADGQTREVPDTDDPEWSRAATPVALQHQLIGLAHCLERGSNDHLRDEGEDSIFGPFELTSDFAEGVGAALVDFGLHDSEILELTAAYMALAKKDREEVDEAVEGFGDAP